MAWRVATAVMDVRGSSMAAGGVERVGDGWRGSAALSIAITGKGDASADAFVATAELIAARKNFLHVYNRVAKPIVRGVLAHLGREDEFPLFFKDLTVNEGGSSTPAQNAPTATPT